MIRAFAAYIATLTTFLVLDFVWLGYIAGNFYRSELGPLLLERPNLLASALFYALYAIGIVIFAVSPALQSQSWTSALLFGALFGLFAYATYDMTNYATLRGFPLTITLLDMAWGMVVTGISATVAYAVTASLRPA
jgi:uncharacterized membrane protein